MPSTPHIAALDDDRAGYQQASSTDVSKALFERVVAETLDRPMSIGERFKQMPGVGRAALVVLAVTLFVAIAILFGLRQDAVASDVGGLVVSALVGLAMAGGLCGIALRGLHRSTGALNVWVLVTLGLVVPAVLAAWNVSWTTGPVVQAPPTAYCYGFGLINGTWFALVLVGLQRYRRGAFWRMAAVSAAAGLCAFVALNVHCPSRAGSHLLWGHATTGMTLLAMSVLGRARERVTFARINPTSEGKSSKK